MKRHWEPNDLIEHWTLLPAELELLANKTGATRLGFALLLKYFQLEGRFPHSKHDIPKAALPHIARQVGVPVDQYLAYDWSGRSIKGHRAQIRAWLGFREATVEDAEQMVTWLSDEVLPSERHLETLKAAMYQHCRDCHIEPPTPDRLERLLRTALHRFDERFCASVFDRLPPEKRTRLDALLHPPESAATMADEASEPGPAVLHALKADPGRVGLESVLTEIAKLQRLRQFDLSSALFPHVAPKVLATYRHRAAAEGIHELRRHPEPLRMTLLASFCILRSQEITDSLVELLMDVIQRMGVRAEHKVEQALITDLKRVAGKQGILFDVAEAAVAHPDGSVREVIYPAAGGEQTLQDLVREAKAQGRTYRQQVHTVMRASYSNHYRRMVPQILEVLEFRSNNEVHRPLMRALDLLKRYAASTQLTYAATDDVPLDGVVRSVWRDLVVKRDKDGVERVNRINYELCVLQTLREQLRCKELWVVGASRFRNPDDDLPADFPVHRDTYYAALSQPRDADAFIAKLHQELTAALEALNKEIPKNHHVKILRKPKGHIKVSPLEPQPESVHVNQVKDLISQAWANTNLLDMLKETDLRVGFSDAFKSATAWENLDRATLQKRLLLCLFGLGTNTGLKRISAGGHGESYKDLLYVRRRFIHKEHLRMAIGQIADAIFRIRQPHIWGEGTTVCASDSKKFGAWDQNLMTEWHQRYHGRGIMIYWHVEKKATCIYSQLKSCSSSEVAAMMEGVLRHDTEMTVTKHMVDSHGQSEIAFAFSHVLGFQLLPRLKAIHHQKLYYSATGQADAYPNLEMIMSRPIDWERIRQQYDEIIKYATALRLGTAETEAILRRFTRQNVQHPTYKALAELGKVIKTIFLCQYLRSLALRREIHEALNVVENWNSANNFIFYGRGGEIATNRLDDQEVAMLALHLLQISLVYINTLMIQRVLTDQQLLDGLKPEDYRALTPLIYSHVNPYGSFELDMSKRIELDILSAA